MPLDLHREATTATAVIPSAGVIVTPSEISSANNNDHLFGSFLRACWLPLAPSTLLGRGSRHCHGINYTHCIETEMPVHLTKRWGHTVSDPNATDLLAALEELTVADPEHPDCWLADEKGWTTSAFCFGTDGLGESRDQLGFGISSRS
jgi:hypothetical protein